MAEGDGPAVVEPTADDDAPEGADAGEAPADGAAVGTAAPETVLPDTGSVPTERVDARLLPPRHARRRAQGAWGTVGKAIASAVAVLVVGVVGTGGYLAADLVQDVVAAPGIDLGNEQQIAAVPDIGAMEGGFTFLLIGSDKRPADGAFGDPEEESGVLNDVNMLLHISQDHSHVEVVSFPRDLLVDTPECTNSETGVELPAQYEVKLNSILHDGGASCVVQTISNLVGIDIPFAGVIEFYAVAALSEVIGGVEVCVGEDIDDDYTGVHLTAGYHTLSGMDALQFLRTRHGVADGSDLGRISNQQIFLSALVRTIEQNGVLRDPVALYGIAKAILGEQYLTLSTNLQNPLRLVSIAGALRSVDLSRIAFVQYPTVYTSDMGAVVPGPSAELVNAALQQDAAIQLDAAAQAGSEVGTTADPNQPVAPPPAPSTGATTAPPTGGAVEVLPGDVLGQTAEESRCSRGGVE